MIFRSSGTLWLSRNLRVSPWAVQKKSTSMSSSGSWVQRELVGEGQVGFAVETFVHVGYLVAGVARAVDEDDFRLRMVQQQADEFACRVAGSADNSYFNHIYVCLILILKVTVLLLGDNQHQQQVDDGTREDGEYGRECVNNADDGGVERKIVCDAGAYTGQHAAGARASEFLFCFHGGKIRCCSVHPCAWRSRHGAEWTKL